MPATMVVLALYTLGDPLANGTNPICVDYPRWPSQVQQPLSQPFCGKTLPM